MASHKFKVGQVVGFSSSPRDGALVPMREYKVLRLLPHERGECSYLIKTITESLERVTKESELEMHSSLLMRTIN